eukprot:COSAG04_NODE_1789_length_5578_cov_9.159153_2_plen_95_part_00
MSAEINGEHDRQPSFLAGLRLLTPMRCLAEVMLTIRDALSTLADQLPDSDASIHLPPVSPHKCTGSGSERSFRFEAKRLFGPHITTHITTHTHL